MISTQAVSAVPNSQKQGLFNAQFMGSDSLSQLMESITCIYYIIMFK